MVKAQYKTITVPEVLCPICGKTIPFNKTIHSFVAECRMCETCYKNQYSINPIFS